jgi:hypothetical protein
MVDEVSHAARDELRDCPDRVVDENSWDMQSHFLLRSAIRLEDQSEGPSSQASIRIGGLPLSAVRWVRLMIALGDSPLITPCPLNNFNEFPSFPRAQFLIPQR